MNTATAQPQDVAPARASIVAHPWFPKLIGLWCAALFGLCSLALAPAMLERIVSTLGIDQIVPAAAPPLGQTARLLLALGLSGVGEIVGLIIGRRLAASHVPQTVRQRGLRSASSEATESEGAPILRDRDRHPDAPARKPLSASSDLGDEVGQELGGIDNALRRRALISETEPEHRPFFEAAPVPGGDWQLSAIDQHDAAPVVADEPAHAFVASQPEAIEAFDLGAFEVPADPVPEAIAEPVAASPAAPFAPPVLAVMAQAPDAPLVQQTENSGEARAEIAEASLDRLGVVQLSERLALALQARRARRARAALATLPLPSINLAPVAPVSLAPLAIARFDKPEVGPEVAEAAADVPVEALPLAASQALDEPLELPEPAPFAQPVVALGDAQSVAPRPRLAGFMAPPFSAPALFAPLAHTFGEDADDDDGDESIPALARSLTMPRLTGNGFADVHNAPNHTPVPAAAAEQLDPAMQRGLEILARRAPKPAFEPEAFAQQPPAIRGAAVGDEAEDLSDDTLEAGYSSLLAMGSGFHRPEAVRIEEPHSDEIEPVVIFPGQGSRIAGDAAPFKATSLNAPYARPSSSPVGSDNSTAAEPANPKDAEETDRALRAALASLQRISGAR